MSACLLKFLTVLLTAASLCGAVTVDTPASELITGVYLEPAHRVVKRQADQAIRIFLHYDDSVNSGDMPAAKRGIIQNDVLPRLLTFLRQTLAVRATSGPILLNRNCTTPSFFPATEGRNVRACVVQCQAETRCGTVVVPADHLKRCVECNGGQSNQCVTNGTDGSGVSNVDFILYVSARDSECPPTSNSNVTTLAFAGACQMEEALDRPVAGYINFCPARFTDTSNEFLFSVSKHEIIHALAFARSLFPFWRDPQGQPRTQRIGSANLPPIVNGLLQWDATTIRRMTYRNWRTRTGVVPHTVDQMVTPRVLEEARAHFNCSGLEGVELENQGGGGTALSHWEKRILGNEAMTGQFTFNPVFSRITFAALEDSGWYQVNYSMADDLVWGRNAGCRFATGSCGEWIQRQQNNNRTLAPFCDRLNTAPRRLGCTLDRGAVSSCNLAQHTRSLPNEYQYFNSGTNFGSDIASRVGGGMSVADFCPFQQTFQYTDGRGTNCTNTTNSPSTNFFAETYALGSRCVEQGRQWTWSTATQISTPTTYGAGCYQYQCGAGGVVIYLLRQGFSCACEGEELVIDLTVDGVRYQGSIICPSCFQICHDNQDSCPSPEPASCYGRTTQAQVTGTQPPTTQPPTTQPPTTQPPTTQPPTTQPPTTQPPTTQPPTTQPPTTQPPTTQPPTTQPPTTQPPTTQPPTTQPPTTQPPTTQPPTTQPPTTQPPTTQPPTTQPPTTQPPTTQPPTTQPPTTQPPTTQPPTTQPPTTQPPTTQPPTTQPPTTQPPTTQPPTTQPPTTQPPTTQPPTTQPPTTQPPTTQPATTQPATTQPPTTQPPTTQPPTTQLPTTQPPTTQLPTTQPPTTQPPTTQPPTTQPPTTQPPTTQPPTTQPPTTQPPTTQPPTTQPPTTQLPTTQPPTTQPPTTQLPTTQPPTTQPPTTQPPTTQPPTTQPPTTQPPTMQPPTTQPPTTQPPTQPPTMQPPTTQPPTTQPPTTQPLTTQPPTTQPSATQPPTQLEGTNPAGSRGASTWTLPTLATVVLGLTALVAVL